MLFKVLVLLSLFLPSGLIQSNDSNAEISPEASHQQFKITARKYDRSSAAQSQSQKYKKRVSNIRVQRFLFPSCDGLAIGGVVEQATGLCGRVEQARARNCPMGTAVAFVRDQGTGEEALQGVRGLPTSCTANAGPAPVQITTEMVTQEFQVLPIRGSGIVFQPEDGKPVINLPFIVQTQINPQLVNTTILGILVLIEATPTRFTWDYGDGSDPFVTTDPNKRYPDHVYEHTYTNRGPVTVTLETTWQGRFQVSGGAWQSIPGTVTTNESATEIIVTELLPVNIN